MSIFNADSDWSLPRSVVVKRTNGEFGFSVIGAAPVIVQSLDEKGPAKVRRQRSAAGIPACPHAFRFVVARLSV